MRQLRKALTRDAAKLTGANDKTLSRWLDKFDPKAEYGLPPFQRAVKDILKIKFKNYVL
jgi:3-phenylpropionate/cinnamic acid dioxygenase small subunit